MEREKKHFWQRVNREWLVDFIILAVILGSCIFVINTGYTNRFTNITQIDGISLMTGWKDSEGKEYNLRCLPHQDIELSVHVGDVNLHNKRLCFKSVDTNLVIKADGMIIYSYDSEPKNILGRSYGMYMHEVEVPNDATVLEMDLEPIFRDMPPKIDHMQITDPGVFVRDIFEEGLPGFCFCVLMLVLGGIMIIIGIIGKDQNEFYMLGTFSIIIALWCVNDTMILQMLTDNPSVTRLLNYMTFIFLPYPPVLFVQQMTGNRQRWLSRIVLCLVVLNFIINVLFTSFNISDYHYFVIQGQVVIVFAIIAGLYMICYAVKYKTCTKRLLSSLAVGSGFTVISILIDLIRYHMNVYVMTDVGAFTRVGVFMFLVVVGLYLIQEYNNKLIESNRVEVMTQLAYTDALTGLKNRLSFNEREKQLKVSNECCIIIQLDINNLKVVNDVYGHLEGDRHITNAAEIIQDCFSDKGDCYRTGGDEFIVVISGSDDERYVKKDVEKMRELSDFYNKNDKPPVPLGIAYGVACCKGAAGELAKTMQLADQRMYECKHRMKAAQG